MVFGDIFQLDLRERLQESLDGWKHRWGLGDTKIGRLSCFHSSSVPFDVMADLGFVVECCTLFGLFLILDIEC